MDQFFSNGKLNVTALKMFISKLDDKKIQKLYYYLNKSGITNLSELSVLREGISEVPITEYAAYRYNQYLLLYIPPILLILGLFGNGLAVAVLLGSEMRKTSTYTYLAVLSVADSLVLIVGLLRLWLAQLLDKDLQDYSDWSCKLINVFAYTISDWSVWLLITVTVERWVAICYPLKTRYFSTHTRAVKITLSLLLALCLVNLHFFFTVSIDEQGFCAGGKTTAILVHDIWPWVDAILYSLLPFVIIFVLNGLIIRQVYKSKLSRQQMNVERRSNPNAVVGARVSSESGAKITLMLLAVSICFLITTLPMNVNMVVAALYQKWSVIDNRKKATLMLVRTIVELLMFCHHSSNFYLYCTTGSRFRQQLRSLLCRHGRRTSQQHTLVTNVPQNHSLAETKMKAVVQDCNCRKSDSGQISTEGRVNNKTKGSYTLIDCVDRSVEKGRKHDLAA